MSTVRICPQCGGVLDSNAPDGLCPNCRGQSTVREQRDAAADISPDLISSEPHAERIGNYKLLQKIGEGGFGVVYMADQEQPVKRRVALKVIKLGMDTRQVVARFEAERQALALMDHPNIARVFDGGATDSGRPYFVMELVKGIKITQYCDQNHVGLKERLDLFLQVCQAIQHAHQKGIIHRDIKPSNIMVTMHDGRPVPKVIDFGIAKATEQRLTDKTLFTQYEQFMGTPAYMSPEQAEMTGLDIDTRSDIYSLGVLLYELLTGRTPFDNETLLQRGIEEARRAIREVEPPRPSTKLTDLVAADVRRLKSKSKVENPKSEIVSLRRLLHERKETINFVRGDLDWIVMKCLEKDRTRRYETTNGLAMDIKRYLNQEPVIARPPSNIYRFQKLVRRNKAAFAAAAMIVTALLVGLGAATWSLIRERTARADADRERQRAVRGEAAARGNLYDADMNLALQAHSEGNLGRVLELLDMHRPGHGQTDPRGWEWRYLWHQTRSDELFTLGSHSNIVGSLAFSPDGKTVASGSWDGSVKIWDVSRRRELKKLGHPNWVTDLFYSSDAAQLATACADGTIRIWDTANWSVIHVLTNGPSIASAAFAPNLGLVAAAASESVTLWDLKARQVLRQWPTRGYDGPLAIGLAFSPDEKILAFHRRAGEIVLWDVSSQSELGSLLGHTNKDLALGTSEVLALAFSPDGQTLVSGGQDKLPRVWDVATRRERIKLTEFSSWVGCLRFSPDGKALAGSSADQKIKLWETEGWEEIATLKGHSNEVWSIAFSPDGSQLASGGKDDTVRVWSASLDSRGKAEVMRLPSLIPYSNWSHLSPDGIAVVTKHGSTSNITHSFWRNDQWKEVPVQHSLPAKATVVAVSPGGQIFALAVPGGGLLLWHSAGHLPPASLTLSGARIRQAIFSPDGQILAVGRSGGAIELWNVRENTLIAQLGGGKVDSRGWRSLQTGGFWQLQTGTAVSKSGTSRT